MTYLFSEEQGNLLVRLLLSHVVADFILQSKTMLENKTWRSRNMVTHIAVVFLATLLFSLSFKIALVVAFTHWLIDSCKAEMQKLNKYKEHTLFVIDQCLHLLVILYLWAFTFDLYQRCIKALLLPFQNYKISLYILAYSIVIWPLGYLIRFALHKMVPPTNADNIERGGKLIGQFERIIILTFVLLSQYEAIGFLITGKSIIRFADKNSEVKSEYVLVGTMMSYAFSILIGLGVKFLIKE